MHNLKVLEFVSCAGIKNSEDECVCLAGFLARPTKSIKNSATCLRIVKLPTYPNVKVEMISIFVRRRNGEPL